MVLPGAWNRAILTPDWLSAKGVLSGILDVEFQIAPPFTLRVSTPELAVHLVGPQLVFSLSSVAIQNLSLMHTKALLLLSELPQTPVDAVGMNFSFETVSTTPALAAYLAAAGHPTEMSVSRIQLSSHHQDDVTVNVILDMEPERPTCDVNFHMAGAANAASARDRLAAQQPLELLNVAKRLALRMLHESGEDALANV